MNITAGSLNLTVGKKALLTTLDWFVAPDGKQYKSVFGTIKSIRSSEETLGIKTNLKSTNWYVEIGNMTIAGCQINYGIATNSCILADIQELNKEHLSPSIIYNADIGYE